MSKVPSYDYNNLTKQQQDCLGLIESLGIYELRALARVFGDNSPTTLKRNDHIRIVMDKIISGEDLKPIPLRQGRPYKELSNIEGILADLSEISGKDYTLKQTQARSVGFAHRTVNFRQADESVLSKHFPVDVKGILRAKNDHEFFLIDEGAERRRVLVKKEFGVKLKPFDYITGCAILMNSENEFILESIKTVNFQKLSNYVDNEEPYQIASPNQKLTLGENEITLGSRYLIKGKFIDNFRKIENYCEIANKNDIITLAVIPNVMAEDRQTYEDMGFSNVLMLNYDESPVSIYENLSAFLGNVKRLQELGKNLMIFVEDLASFANSVDYALKNTSKGYVGHNEATIDLLKQVMMTAKADRVGKNTTLFISYDDVDMFDPFFVSSVYKVSKKLD